MPRSWMTGVLCLVLSAAPSAPAGAAARGCPTVPDPRGDVSLFGVAGLPDDKADVQGTSVGGDRSTFALEIDTYAARLTEPDPYSPGGRVYVLIARVGPGIPSGGPWIGFNVFLDAAGGVWDYAAVKFSDPNVNPVTQDHLMDAGGIAVDNATGKIRVWVDYEAFDDAGLKIRPGARVTYLWGSTSQWITGVPHGWQVDQAAGPVSYRLRDRSCIPVGR